MGNGKRSGAPLKASTTEITLQNYQKQAQDFYSKGPVIILGSGASAAHGLSGMGALANHLLAKIDTSGFSSTELMRWNDCCQLLRNGVDLETVLNRADISEDLTLRITQATWELINAEDLNVFEESLQNSSLFPLSRLLQHVFKSSLRTINIVTTNYDRLAEYACDHGRIHHYTGFTHGFFRQLSMPTAVACARRVNIWKVHGSLDWFQTPLKDTIAVSARQSIPQGYIPQIVTPGAQKYHKTHLEPFRSIINSADSAINEAGSYLCVGYGFNDEHVQPKLMARCLRQQTPITIITYKLSNAARQLIIQGKAPNYLAIERGDSDDQSIVYSSLFKDPLVIEGELWSLSGYLNIIM